MRKYVVNISECSPIMASSDQEAIKAFSRIYAGIKEDVLFVEGFDGRWHTLKEARKLPELFPVCGDQLELPLTYGKRNWSIQKSWRPSVRSIFLANGGAT